MPRFSRAGADPWVFFILLGTYAFFWQSRDWNSATRLMLTYSLVERGTVTIDGLEDQTGDRASFRGHSYTDKLPGFSLVATAPYAVARQLLRLPDHPLHTKAIAYWPADYWVTLATSGLFTACTGVLLVGLARDLGCGPRRAALVGLAYGLGTPAFAYATMSHGHQTSAFLLLASFVLLRKTSGRYQAFRVGLAGFLASYAAVVELQVGPVSAILGLYLIGQVIARVRKWSHLGDFAVGAVIPALVLLGYDQLAYGSPWDMGYFHHVTKVFADVHSEKNPLGLTHPQAARALALLWGRHRGLLFYAPIVILTPIGLVALMVRKLWDVAIVTAAVMAAVFAVNLSYPEWTGGWSTGPRLLVPLLPFALIPVAGLLGWAGRWATGSAIVLALAGVVLMLLFVAVGGKIRQDWKDPLVEAVWPLWQGREVPGWIGEPFARNLVGLAFPGFVASLNPALRWLQFVPLLIGQGVGIAAMLVALAPGRLREGEAPAEPAVGARPEPRPPELTGAQGKV